DRVADRKDQPHGPGKLHLFSRQRRTGRNLRRSGLLASRERRRAGPRTSDRHRRGKGTQAEADMAETVADFMLRRLGEWGVRRVYGYPGDGINGIMSALDRAGDAIEFIQTRHEESAAFMACGHAKYTGELGVCLATS